MQNSLESRKSFTSLEIRQAAIDAEYKIFSTNKVVTTYRRSMAFLLAEVKKKTDSWELHQVLLDLDCSISMSDKDNESKSKTKQGLSNQSGTPLSGFQTALQLSQSQAIASKKIVDNEIQSNSHDISFYFKGNQKSDALKDSFNKTMTSPGETEINEERDDNSESYLEAHISKDKQSVDSSRACEMKEPNKNKDKELKKTSKNKILESKRSGHLEHKRAHSYSESKQSRKPPSKETKYNRTDKQKSVSNEDAIELEKALKRIRELEETNEMLANRRINELEKANKILSHSEEKSKSHKREHGGSNSRRHISIERDRMQSTATNPDDANKEELIPSNSNPPMFTKSGRAQSKLKLLGLSDSDSSGTESNEENQAAAFENLFGCSNLSSKDKKKQNINTKNSKFPPQRKKGANLNEHSSYTKGKKPNNASEGERCSSSSPNLSDLDERMQVEKEVIQIIAEEEAEHDYILKDEGNEHEQLAAWLGNNFIFSDKILN